MSENHMIYLDYAATTPVDERVLDRMWFFFHDHFGNPSSNHQYGQMASVAVDQARKQVSAALGCQPEEAVFTSCGTESDNLALRGVGFARLKAGFSHILISPVEHHAVSKTAEQMAAEFGFTLELLPVDGAGRVDPDDVSKRIRPDTALVSVIYANNEIGTVNPIAEMGAVCREKGIPFHTDAVQAAAHLPIDVSASSIDLLSIGAHKFYGPKGVGAIYVRNGVELWPMQTGGSQENKRRAGTENVPYIVGLGEALTYARAEREETRQRLAGYRDLIISAVLDRIPDSRLTGHPTERLPNHASFVFKGVDGNLLLMMLDAAGYACSSGSACKTGNPTPSDVLLAIGLPPEWALGSLRVTAGKGTSAQEIEQFLDILPDLVQRVRSLR